MAVARIICRTGRAKYSFLRLAVDETLPELVDPDAGTHLYATGCIGTASASRDEARAGHIKLLVP